MTHPKRWDLFRRYFAISTALALTLLCAATAPAVEEAKQDPAPAESDEGFLRVNSERGKSIALEVAITTYTHKDNDEAPVIALVGVAHIADRSFYQELQKRLDAMDLVLYESVKPAGCGGAGGDTAEERRVSTIQAMKFIASIAERYFEYLGTYPKNTAEMELYAETIDGRLAAFVHAASLDAWGRPFHYAVLESEPPAYELASFGADGERGGNGEDADLTRKNLDDVKSFTQGSDGGIQAQLAEALSLSFQLNEIDYARVNFKCSDMAIDQVQRALDERDVDFTVVEDMLQGGGITGAIAKALLNMIKFADGVTDGAVSDTVKVVLIEMLGDEDTLDISMKQLGEGFDEVIIGERNQVVLNDLKAVLEGEPTMKTIGVFYGAGHMKDLAERMDDQLGYERSDVCWLKAIEIDLEQSAMSQREMLQMRLMVRRMLRQMRAMSGSSDDS